jgi:hypothetical protein
MVMDDQKPDEVEPQKAADTIADAWAAVLIDIHEKRMSSDRKANEGKVGPQKKSKGSMPECRDDE